MGRLPRVIVPNAPHHIVQRGHNRNAVFVEDADYQYYLDSLLECKSRFGVKVYSWCLMTNHVHLILDPGEDLTSISVTMKTLAAKQTRRVNELERRTGSLWEGRFKLSPIETSEYLLQCCRYVDLNPVKARVVNEPDEYRWSSFRSKTGREPSGILDKDECYLGFTNPENDYCNFVRDGIPDDEYQFIKNQLSRNQLTGGDRFTDEVERRIGIRVEARAQGRPRSTPTDK